MRYKNEYLRLEFSPTLQRFCTLVHTVIRHDNGNLRTTRRCQPGIIVEQMHVFVFPIESTLTIVGSENYKASQLGGNPRRKEEKKKKENYSGYLQVENFVLPPTIVCPKKCYARLSAHIYYDDGNESAIFLIVGIDP